MPRWHKSAARPAPWERRTAVVSSRWATATLTAAQGLADLVWGNVESFIEHIVRELRDHEARAGALRALGHAAAFGARPVAIPVHLPPPAVYRAVSRWHSGCSPRCCRGGAIGSPMSRSPFVLFIDDGRDIRPTHAGTLGGGGA